ncbi:MAG: Rieske (2Fe-2S) protein [Pseudomonadota bacterium]
MALETVAKLDEMPVGSRKVVQAGNTKILLFHLETGFYATQAYCPHLFAPLKNGKLLEGGILQCPFHRAQFDIATGEVIRWANFPPGIQALNVLRAEKCLTTYPVVVAGDRIQIDIR